MNDDKVIIESPINAWFELSYAQFLTIPRLVMQSMPMDWQTKMAKLLYELDETFDWRPKEGRYWVRLKDGKGRYCHASLADYRRGSCEDLRINYLEGEGHLADRFIEPIFVIKPLKFTPCDEWRDQKVLVCDTPIGRYEIYKKPSCAVNRRLKVLGVEYVFPVARESEGEDEAIAAAQADYKKLMLEGLLEVQP